MIKFYLNRIHKGLMEVGEVPAKWREQVIRELEKQ